MPTRYSPVVAHPRPIPRPLHALEALLVAWSIAIAVGPWEPGAAVASVMIFVPVLISMAVDALGRSHFIGAGLERSIRQLVVLGATVAVLVVVGIGLESLPGAVAVIVAVVSGVILYAVLRWDQSVQLSRARAIARNS